MRKQGWRNVPPLLYLSPRSRKEVRSQSDPGEGPCNAPHPARTFRSSPPSPRNAGEREERKPVTVITDPLFYALAVPAVVALGLSKGGFAGVGQMATPMLALVMPPLEAAAIMLPIMIIQDATAVWVYRKDWSGRILAIVIPGGIAGVAAGGLLAAHISEAAVRVFIGCTTIAFVLYSWIGPQRIAQAGSPPYQMYVLSLKLPKMTFVGTSAIFFASMNWLKVIPYFALGQFSTKGLGTSLALLPLAIATNQLGFYLVRRVSQELFYKITLIAMFLISIELVREGATQIWRG